MVAVVDLDPPRRAYSVQIEIGADDWPALVRELARLADHIEAHGPDCKQVSGGYDTGSTVRVEHRPEMTHDKYVEELNTYLEALRSKRVAVGGAP